MEKFYIHGFLKERVKFEVFAESRDAAAAMADAVFDGQVGVEVEREITNEWDTYILVDPVREDGSVDYENAKWYPEEAE